MTRPGDDVDPDYEQAYADNMPERSDEAIVQEIVDLASRPDQPGDYPAVKEQALHRIEGLARALLVRWLGRTPA